MTKTRRKFTAEQRAAIVRRHLKDKVPISSIERAFEKSARSEKVSQRAEAKINELKDQRIKKLEEKLIHKNEVIAELMEENVKAKKANGDL
jgi:transposase-like protein